MTTIEHAAYHEAGHGVAAVLAFRTVQRPIPLPPYLVKHVRIHAEESGKWGGRYCGPEVYSPRMLVGPLSPEWRQAMEWQMVVDLAGGVAEAIHRKRRNKRTVWPFVMFECGVVDDRKKVWPVLDELRRLTRRRHGEEQFARRAYVLLRQHWLSVDAVAAILISDKYIEGSRVEALTAAGEAGR